MKKKHGGVCNVHHYVQLSQGLMSANIRLRPITGCVLGEVSTRELCISFLASVACVVAHAIRNRVKGCCSDFDENSADSDWPPLYHNILIPRL
jgi:hypothetical protein